MSPQHLAPLFGVTVHLVKSPSPCCSHHSPIRPLRRASIAERLQMCTLPCPRATEGTSRPWPQKWNTHVSRGGAFQPLGLGVIENPRWSVTVDELQVQTRKRADTLVGLDFRFSIVHLSTLSGHPTFKGASSILAPTRPTRKHISTV